MISVWKCFVLPGVAATAVFFEPAALPQTGVKSILSLSCRTMKVKSVMLMQQGSRLGTLDVSMECLP